MRLRLKLKRFILLIFLLGLLFFPTFSKIQHLKSKELTLQHEIEKLEAKNRRLLQENERLKADPLYIEAVARDKLKMAKENEIVLRVIEAEKE